MRSRGYLPHWQVDDADYFITYRLADSLPQSVVVKLKQERQRLREAIAGNRPLTIREKGRLDRLLSLKVDQELDAGFGACHMKDSRIASLIAGNLMHFDGSRYELRAWSVMPNHVHVVLYISAGSDLPGIVHSWKSYTSKEAKRILGVGSTFWQAEYFDRVIRNQRDLESSVRYTLDNPQSAGLVNWPWVWSRS